MNGDQLFLDTNIILYFLLIKQCPEFQKLILFIISLILIEI